MYLLKDNIIENCGNKAMFLSMLTAKGYNIPSGVVIGFEEFKSMVKEQNLNFDTIDKLQISDEVIDEIFNVIPNSKMLAVRSSANIENCRNCSLAGRYATFLNVAHDRECLKDKIKECFLSLYSKDNILYYKKNNIDISKVEMNVIVQEMIESNVSGILFSVNPTNGKDTEIVIEFSIGSGATVSGKIIPERLVYDWKNKKYIEEPKINLLGDTSIRRIINISLTLQQELGFPIEIEFGVYDSKLYIYQIRPITKIEYKDVYYRYSNSSMDGLKIVSPFILSLDEYIYSNTFVEYIEDIKAVANIEVLKPIVFSKFSRLYWNIDQFKAFFDFIPGYVERYLDDMLRVMVDYLDNGKVFLLEKEKKVSIFSKVDIFNILKRKIINTDEYRNDITNKLQAALTIEDLYQRINKLIEIYVEVKKAYIYQRNINLSYRINFNQRYGRILNKSELDSLLMGIDNKYENAPYLYMWDNSRRIKNNKQKMNFFEENLDAEIYYIYVKDRNNENIKEFLTDFIDLYGYHSFDGEDIINKTYEEEVLKVVKMYRDILELGNEYDPLSNFKEENKYYEEVMQKLEGEYKSTQYKSEVKHIEFVRELKIKEYALKDLTLICMSKLRKELLKLGKKYKEEYILESEEDIFYLDYHDIINKINLEDIKSNSNINKIYYNSFRNYEPQNDIFPCLRQQIEIDYKKRIQGVGASFGKVSGRACVVNSKEDLKNLKKSDVIVTKYLDKELFDSVKISQVSGIITEFGGVLCHFAINARENRIPCVVGIKDVTSIISTGENIVLNGDTGEVII